MQEFHTYTLPNGIRGIHRQVRSNVAHCALVVGAGTRDELKSEYGLAHTPSSKAPNAGTPIRSTAGWKISAAN